MAIEGQCPKCKRHFDLSKHEVVECPRCERRGSTYCCNLGGRMVICGECELEEEYDGEQ
jgi:hypothetical protein